MVGKKINGLPHWKIKTKKIMKKVQTQKKKVKWAKKIEEVKTFKAQ